MDLRSSTTSRFRSTKRTVSNSSLTTQRQKSPHVVSIHVLDDDSLLNIFYLYRPFFLGEDEMIFNRIQGGRPWGRGRWWYQLSHVCQRWRNLILRSASYLHLSLVCTNGTPVANMLAHSPYLPLTVDYRSEYGITPEDESGLLLALEQRHRVRHLRLILPVKDLRKFIMAIDGELPILEYLIVDPRTKDSTALVVPETLQVPHLRHLVLHDFASPIRSRLHPTATGLVTLYLGIYRPSAYFQPNVLLQSISFVPQLETLAVIFTFPVPNRDVERRLTHTLITTHITFPNLRLFSFRGVSAYLEALVCRIITPRLEDLQIRFFQQLKFSVPRLVQFMDTTENLRFDSVDLDVSNMLVRLGTNLHGTNVSCFAISVDCWLLDWQVSSVAQLSNALSQVFSVAEHLTIRHEAHTQSSEEHNDVDRIEWRKLLRSFSKVKTLVIQNGLIEELSRCLRLDDEELPLELLPELRKLTYSGSVYIGGAFTSFIDARKNTSRPVTLVHPTPNPDYTVMMQNYLQGTGEAHLPSWEFSQIGSGRQATHTATVKLSGHPISQGSASTRAIARQIASYHFLKLRKQI